MKAHANDCGCLACFSAARGLVDNGWGQELIWKSMWRKIEARQRKEDREFCRKLDWSSLRYEGAGEWRTP